jgi:hypothetical protein
MTYWVIIVTFAVGTVQPGHQLSYSHLLHDQRLFDEVVKDKQGRAVIFTDYNRCMKVTEQVVDKMLKNGNLMPLNARCVKAQVQK